MLTSKFKSIRMQEDQTFFVFYFELSDIVNSCLNLREVIPESKIVRKILRSLSERFRPNVIAIKESKVVDSIRVDELIVSLQTYEMTLLDSQKHKKSIFKASKNTEKETKNYKEIGRDKLAPMSKRKKEALKFQRRSNKK